MWNVQCVSTESVGMCMICTEQNRMEKKKKQQTIVWKM